jgi:SAM-dependent methyltransferase
MADRCVIYCLEPDPACAPFYRQWGLIPVASLEAVPEAIDFAYLIEVVEHLEHPVSTLRRLRQVLSPGGRVLLSTPEGSRCPRHTNAYDDPTHLHFFTPRSLNRALSAAGFEPLDFRRHPEMYSLPARRLGRVLHRARAIARPFLLPLVRRHVKYGHLAGVTRPR